MRNTLSIALLSALLGCGGNSLDLAVDGDDDALVAEAPLLGADGNDAADRGCNVVLRKLERRPNSSGGYETSCTTAGCFYVWTGTLDISAQAAAEAARPYVLYQSGSNPSWLQVSSTKTTDAPAGFVRYLFKLKKGTVSSGASTSALMNTRIRVSPFLRTASGARLFDHNRVPGDFDSYLLSSANGWAISDDPAVCRPPPPPVANRATVRFLSGWQQAQHGALVAGGKLVVDYDISRLGTCRNTHNGFPAWDLQAYVRFSPGGQLAQGTVRGFDAPLGVPQMPGKPVPFETTIPAGATWAELWFQNTSGAGSTCVAWDSNSGHNYGFQVLSAPPPAIGWAGNLGGSFSRDCVHQTGLAEPMVLDSYIQQRACMFIDADVWVPGLTDAAAEHPERLLVQAEVTIDGRPATTTWLSYAGRVGNDYRFRWTLPRQAMNDEFWNTIRYIVRFSSDGAAWYRVGQSQGPAGGLPRTLERDPSWCNPAWASCAR